MHGLSSMMLMEGSPAVTRMLHASEEGFQNTMASEEEGSSPSTYDIVMLSLSGSLLLFVAISVAISILRRRCTSSYSSKDLSMPVVVENIMATKGSSGKISTADLPGPACISYVPDKRAVSPEFAVAEETISVFEYPLFSFAVSITPPDSAPTAE